MKCSSSKSNSAGVWTLSLTWLGTLSPNPPNCCSRWTKEIINKQMNKQRKKKVKTLPIKFGKCLEKKTNFYEIWGKRRVMWWNIFQLRINLVSFSIIFQFCYQTHPTSFPKFHQANKIKWSRYGQNCWAASTGAPVGDKLNKRNIEAKSNSANWSHKE